MTNHIRYKTDDEYRENEKKKNRERLNKKYSDDPEYRQRIKEKNKDAYRKKKEEQYFAKHGSLEGFEIRKNIRRS